jgi:hypothetical protein
MFFIDSKKRMSRTVLSAVDMSAFGDCTRPLIYEGRPHPEYDRNSLRSMMVISHRSSRRRSRAATLGPAVTPPMMSTFFFPTPESIFFRRTRYGRITLNVLPFPSLDETEMVPPCALMIVFAMARPSPVPGTIDLCLIERKNGLKISPSSFPGIPYPESVTWSTHRFVFSDTVSLTRT